MPTYIIEHPTTGQKIQLEGNGIPSDTDIREAFASVAQSTPKTRDPFTVPKDEAERMRREFISNTAEPITQVKEKAKDVLRAASPYVRPVLEGGGAALGALGAGLAATPETLGAGTVPAGIAGGALGYAGGKNLADMYDESLDLRKGGTVADRLKTTAGDIATGATMEMGGPVVAKGIGLAAKGVGAVAKPVLGRLSGVGTEAIEQGLKSGAEGKGLNIFKSKTAYDKALRGEVTGEEIVDTAKGALTAIKDQRASKYLADLAEVGKSTAVIDDTPVLNTLANKMQTFRISMNNGVVDTSQAAMGKAGRDDIVDTIEEVMNWKDKSPMGMDALKRRLDDFYSDSSQARSFVASIRDAVKQSIVKDVPAYEEMTKSYGQATGVIKDIEAGLMMRKQGMTGRITADQTLKRLQLAMKDDGIKKDLLQILGNKGGEDLMGAVAGYSASNVVPRGLAGTGPALVGNFALAKFVDPSFAGLIVASSPRAQGEFLRLIGKARNINPKYTEQAIKTLAIAGIAQKNKNKATEEKLKYEAAKLADMDETTEQNN